MQLVGWCPRGAARVALAMACALACSSAFAAHAHAQVALEPGVPYKGVVGAVEDGPRPTSASFTFRVGPDVRAIRLELKARADLDLFLARKPIEDYEDDPLLESIDTTGTEILTLSRDGEPALETGTYHVDVAYLRADAPRLTSGRALPEIAFTLTLSAFSARVDGKLEVGGLVRGTIDPAEGPYRTYVVEVDERQSALRLDLVGAEADVNLRVRRARPIVKPGDADHVADTALASEVIVIDKRSTPPLTPGRYYVDVQEPIDLGWPIAFELHASATAEVPAALRALPPMPAATSPIERALYGTVELFCEEAAGSGVLISADGHLITNYHVVQPIAEGGGEVGGPLYVSLTLDRLGAPVALFQAEVVFADEALDLALVRCVKDRYAQALPKGFRFPTVPIGDASALRHGDPLWVLGYPAAGGSGNRVSATFSRGVVSGFERRGPELHLKTDAEVTAGNSGGAALDAGFGLVGFPTETIAEEGGNGQLGYIRPIWLVPAPWWKQAGIDPASIRAPEK